MVRERHRQAGLGTSMRENPKDPLLRVGPGTERALFEAVSRLCEGASADRVVNVAANLIVNAIRQAFSTRDGAERAFDETFGRSKAILMGHYEANGRKKGIFPFDQVISMPLVEGDDSW